ncbi:MAG: isochorismatase family protein [Chloroflexi bacterium]|nr:isochorismatase family protein [Chloroflexota bacterium]
MAIWDDVLAGTDRAVFEAFLRGNVKELGKRPAIVVVDVTYGFVGLKSEPILESMRTYRGACGDIGWASVGPIQELLAMGRDRGVPIVYSTPITDERRGAGWAGRARDRSRLELLRKEELERRRLGYTIIKEIEPRPGDIVINKRGPSAFLGTPLVSYLNELDVDTLLVTGGTTSGCVRATVVDGASYGYYVGIVEEGTFDRFLISHKVSLMDMHAKYGTVISLTEALSYLRSRAEPALGRRQLSAV